MDKRFLTILATLVIIFGGIFVFTQKSSNETGGVKGSVTTSPTDHIEGEGAKNVTLIEYGDFQCQVCLVYEPVVTQVRSAYKADIKFQFRHLPLTSIHPNAFAAARAAEAASLQAKFWEMHDTLYSSDNWQSWTTSSSPRQLFNAYAKQIGLDETRFQADFASEQVNDVILADLEEFKKTGRQMSTPTFFLNGVFVENSKLTDQNNRPQFEKFKVLLDAEIAKSQPQQ